MTLHDDDADEQLLAGIDLHAWRVPPPRADDRPPILVRGLAAPAPPHRRIGWMLVALAIANALIAAILVIILAPSTPAPTVVALPAGGPGSLDAQVRDVVRRLESEQRELERRLAEIEELRALIDELSERLRRYENGDRRDRTVPREPRREPPPRDVPVRDPVADPPALDAQAPVDTSCDEVSCVLTNHVGSCCDKYRKRPRATPPRRDTVLDRHRISAGVASVRARVAACGGESNAKGLVKVSVRVAPEGVVSRVDILQTPDAALARCVAAAVKSAVFERTTAGGSFSYPFKF